MIVTRKQLRLAIREGILRSPGLTTAECAALNRVGRTAAAFGNNFDSKCPVALAGIANVEQRLPQKIWDFVTEFDHQMANIDLNGYHSSERVLVDG